LHVPARDPEDDSRCVPVPCWVRVVRVEKLAETGLYGVACRVENYHFAEAIAEQEIGGSGEQPTLSLHRR
jgi:hypothetical protein